MLAVTYSRQVEAQLDFNFNFGLIGEGNDPIFFFLLV